VSVIARSAQLLRVLAGSGASATLTELSATTGLPLTTVHRLTAELVAEQLVERDEAGGFRVGSGAWEVGRQYERPERFRAVASRYLRDLHEVTRSTVELCQLLRGELIVVERLTLVEPRGWSGRLERVDPATTAAGIAVLAASEPGAADRYLEALTRAEAKVLEAALRDARSNGAARVAEVGGTGVVIAAAIPGRGSPEGAVAVVAADDRTARAYLPSVLVTARRIAAAFSR
jgi:DNA-binding IclR family transcriptional regulator